MLFYWSANLHTDSPLRLIPNAICKFHSINTLQMAERKDNMGGVFFPEAYYINRVVFKSVQGGIIMWTIFAYFLIFFVPGLFAVLVYNLICCHKLECHRIIIGGLIYDWLILGIILTGLRFIKGIATFNCLKTYFNCLSFTSKYFLLSLVIAAVLAILTCFLSHLHFFCNKQCHNDSSKDIK